MMGTAPSEALTLVLGLCSGAALQPVTVLPAFKFELATGFYQCRWLVRDAAPSSTPGGRLRPGQPCWCPCQEPGSQPPPLPPFPSLVLRRCSWTRRSAACEVNLQSFAPCCCSRPGLRVSPVSKLPLRCWTRRAALLLLFAPCRGLVPSLGCGDKWCCRTAILQESCLHSGMKLCLLQDIPGNPQFSCSVLKLPLFVRCVPFAAGGLLELLLPELLPATCCRARSWRARLRAFSASSSPGRRSCGPSMGTTSALRRPTSPLSRWGACVASVDLLGSLQVSGSQLPPYVGPQAL